MTTTPLSDHALGQDGHASAAPIRTLDLFAGAGGLSTGLRGASGRFTPVQAVEMDLAAAATYSLNHGGHLRDGVLTDNLVQPLRIEDWLAGGEVPEVDVVVGGPPCQGFSTLGKRDQNDERNFLWREYAKTVKKSRPRYFVLENVPAFLKSEQFEVFRKALGSRGLLGDYEIEWGVLNAARYGAAQARKRVVVIGHRKDLAAPGLPRPTRRNAKKLIDILKDVNPSVTNTWLPQRRIEYHGKLLAGPYTSRQLHVDRTYTELSLRRFAAIPPLGNRFDLPDDLKAPCWVNHHSGAADVMGRLDWDKPSVTIRTEFQKPEKGRYLHPQENRVITPYEAALIQGFAPGYRWAGSRTEIARQIGNAVPIPLGRAIGRLLLGAMGS